MADDRLHKLKRPQQTCHEVRNPDREQQTHKSIRVELLGAALVGDYLFLKMFVQIFIYTLAPTNGVAEGSTKKRRQCKGIWYVFSDTWEHARVRRCSASKYKFSRRRQIWLEKTSVKQLQRVFTVHTFQCVRRIIIVCLAMEQTLFLKLRTHTSAFAHSSKITKINPRPPARLRYPSGISGIWKQRKR